jgi:nitrous oxidase accessory protein
MATGAALFCVSSLGTDLQERLDSTPPGGLVVLEEGIHTGPLRIDKPITIRGDGHAVVDGGRSGSVLIIDAPDVRISGLVIRNSGLNLEKDDAGILVRAEGVELINNVIESCLHGIYFKKVNGGLVRDNRIQGATLEGDGAGDLLSQGIGMSESSDLCTVGRLDVNRRGNGIHLWNTKNVRLSENHVSRTRDGIYFSFADNCTVTDNEVTDCRYGLHYMYSDGNTFSGNRFSRNAAGAALMYSGRLMVEDNDFVGNRGGRAYGMLLQSVDSSRFRGNRFQNNTVGMYSENSQDNEFKENVLEKNYIGLRLGGSSRGNLHSGNQFLHNTHQVEVNGEGLDNRWALDGIGNRWSRSTPTDLDGDGIGELPHREADLLGNLRQQFPMAGLLSGSPGLELLRFARSRGDIPGVRAIEDPHPLTDNHD